MLTSENTFNQTFSNEIETMFDELLEQDNELESFLDIFEVYFEEIEWPEEELKLEWWRI